MRPADQQRVSQRNRRAAHGALLIVALVFGAQMMAAAIGTPAHAWLGWFALVPLFLVIRRCRPPAAVLGGALWGVCLFIFSSSRPASAITPTIQSFALLAAVPAIYALLNAKLSRRIGFNPFVLGFTWMGVELALGPVGLHTGLVGAAAADGTIVQWIGGALGYVFVAFVVALLSASLVSVLSTAHLSIPQPRYSTPSADRGAPLSPQTFFCFPLFAIHPPRPRAPPRLRQRLSSVAMG